MEGSNCPTHFVNRGVFCAKGAMTLSAEKLRCKKSLLSRPNGYYLYRLYIKNIYCKEAENIVNMVN